MTRGGSIATQSVAGYGRSLMWLAIGSASALAFITTSIYTPLAINPGATLDDGLFLKLGWNLSQGVWLGVYDQHTLAKGPGYPFFLAVSSWLGISLSLSHALFHCGAAAVLAGVVARIVGSQALGVIAFCILLWNPLLPPPSVSREAVYTGQILMAYGLVTYSLLLAQTSRSTIGAAVAAGFVLGWCWLTREEGILLIPGLLVLLIGAAVASRLDETRMRALRAAALTAILTFLGVQAAFQLKNLVNYGAFIGVDFKERNFQVAISALQSVRSDGEMMFVAVPRSARRQIYEVSPAFAELRDYLDGPSASSWQYGCEFWAWTCGDIAGAWWIWALRDAAANRGYYESPVSASQFFGRIADEVRSACAHGQLRCEESSIPYMPRVTREQLSWIPDSIIGALRFVASVDELLLESGPSVGNRREILSAVAFLNFPLHMAPQNSSPRLKESGGRDEGCIKAARRVRSAQSKVFTKFVPILVAVGGVAFACASIWLLCFPSVGLCYRAALPAASLWVTVVLRIAALVLIDVSSFPAIDALYLAPATYLAPVAALLSIWAALAGTREWRARRFPNRSIRADRADHGAAAAGTREPS